MTSTDAKTRYQMINVRPGHVVVEHDILSREVRSYFSDEPAAPVEQYREGKRIWQYAGTAQSYQFDVKDRETGKTVSYRELLGLLYYGCCKPDSDVYHIGELAQEQRISVYVAITYETPEGRSVLSFDKLQVLNALFNERLHTPNKKILILPDIFGLYKTISLGEIMIDFGLTSMEEER